jgi:hypothetical protein
MRCVTSGADGSTAAITSGVEPGERVIVYPIDRIADGVRGRAN